jgi:type II secretory pathway predicted ATPase ExeA
MYCAYYGFAEAPFALVANPHYLFFTAQHRQALSHLEDGLSGAKSITVLTGEAGTGKSTLLRAAIESDRCHHVSCIFLNNPTLTRAEFFEMVASRFAVGAHGDRATALRAGGVELTLRDRQARGHVTALVIDEAQALPDELLDEIRVIANMETTTGKLLPVVLAGQPELMDRLNEPGLRRLRERVALRCELRPLSLADTASYIASRVRRAGGEPGKLFTREAVTLIHEYSSGVPRTISVLCDNALMSGCTRNQPRIDCRLVHDVCRDFDLRPAALAVASGA